MDPHGQDIPAPKSSKRQGPRHATELLTRKVKRRRRKEARDHRWWKTLTVALTALTLTAPVAIPAYYGVDAVASYWDNIPTDLPEPPMAEPSVILAGDGKTKLANVFLYNRDIVSYDDISPFVINALVATEDSRFFDHQGVDTVGIVRAVKVLAEGHGEATQGGSSITQQYVKMTLEAAGIVRDDTEMTQAATQDSMWRKLREAKQALAVEETHSKEEILAGYLNLAYFGAGAYGVQAAAQRFFSVDANEVSLPQAALLAGLVNQPTFLDPTKNPEEAVIRRNHVLKRMLTVGLITKQEHDNAVDTPLELDENPVANGCAAGPTPLFCDWVREELEQHPALGETPSQRRARLLEGGLTITTTLDLDTQAAVEKVLTKHVAADHQLVSAQVVIEPGTGNVLAFAASRPYGAQEGQSEILFPAVETFQPGSTFKPFTLLAALEQGLPTTTVLPGGRRHESKVFDNPGAGYYTNSGDGGGSRVTIAQATTKSINTAYVQLQERVGTQKVVDAAIRAGVTSLEDVNISDREGSLTLGARETSVLQMANAYATIAAHGKACQPRGVEKIVTKTGEELPVGSICKQQFSPAVADTAAALLQTVTENGTGTRAAVKGHEVAGKTGTTQNFGAAWFAGFTPSFASAVWIGDPRGPKHVISPDMFGNAYGPIYGGTVPAKIFHDSYSWLLRDAKPEPLPGLNETTLPRR